jgi:hypothetical protein
MFGQTVGDYRSNTLNTSGGWTTPASWQYFNGTTWISATNYPGEIAGTGAVLIVAGHTITISSVITTQSMGTLTIDGLLILNGGTAAIDFNIITQNIIITAIASITLNSKGNLKLPANSTIQILPRLATTTLKPISGDCSNNQSIFIGGLEYAVCAGNNAATNLTFDTLITNGGSFNAIITANSPLFICAGEAISLTGGKTGISVGTVNYTWSIIGPIVSSSSGQTLNISNTIAGTYVITLTASTTYNSRVYSNSETVSVIVKLLPTAVVAQPADCLKNTGSVSLSGLPTSGSYTLNRTGTSIATITGLLGATYNVLDLAVGTYDFSVSTAGFTSCPVTVFIKPFVPPINTWNGTAWLLTTLPTINQDLVFSGSLTSSADMSGCSCKVNAGANLVFNAGATLKIVNDVQVQGTLTFENTASLVQISDAAINTGNIKYKRKTPTVRSSDYTYWSSPVSPQLLSVFPSGRFYSFGAAANNWEGKTASSTMVRGTGYIVQVPLAASPTTYEVTFDGVPNNGVITTTTGPANSFNLIGNPYPSALDANALLDANTTVLKGTLYFWTHNTAIQLASQITNGSAGSGTYAYTSDDYAAYTRVGGVSTVAAKSGGVTPSGYIAAGQSFFAASSGSGSITFNNSMRLGTDGAKLNNTQFFKIRTDLKLDNNFQRHRLWLNLSNSQGAFKQTLVGYITGGTNEYDSHFDGESFNANAYVDFYSINQNKNLTIQGRALPFLNTDQVPLGFSSKIAGDFTINIDQLDGVFTNNTVFLEDKLTDTIFDLKSGDYKFTTAVGVFNDRFVLRYTNKTLGTADFSILESQVLVSNANRQIQISSSIDNLAKVVVYGITGKQLYAKTKLDAKELQISNLGISHQVLVVKISLQNGQEITKKIIF